MTKGKPASLVAMRLIDMRRVHPQQDNSHSCVRCGQRVGLYPSGQAVLRQHPAMDVYCWPCAQKDRRPDDDNWPAGTLDEIAREIASSVPAGKA